MPIYNLDQKDLPTHYYNIIPDLPRPLDPPLHPGTKQPITGADLAPIFPQALIEQEMSQERDIEIPAPVREAYALYRPGKRTQDSG
jgi:tryptophan synthase beta chain